MVSVVTLLGIFIAVYSVIPRHTRIEFSLRIGRTVIILSIILFLFIIYLNSITLLEAFKPESCSLQEFLKDNSDPITLWTFIFIFLLLITKWSLFRLSRSKLNKFSNLISQLIQEGRVLEMTDIFMKYHKKIIRYSEMDTKYYQFIEKELQKRPDPKIVKEITAKIINRAKEDQITDMDSVDTSAYANDNLLKRIHKLLKNLKYRAVRRILLFLPTGKNYSSKARGILRLAVLSPKVIKFWTYERPYDLIKLLDANIREIFEISNQLLHDQMSDVNSYIYYELEDTQNYFGKAGYLINESNLMILSLLGDSNRADHLHVWTPVGEYALKYLDDLYDSQNDPYNKSCAEFTSKSKWSSPLFVSLHFFDVMVTTALTQNSPSNMWLPYFYYFTDKIIKNINLEDFSIDETDEWPNRYCYLLYQIISIQKEWILYAEFLKNPTENPIIISSISCISQCLEKIVQTDLLSENFIVYIYEIVLRIYFDLRKMDQQELSDRFLTELISGKPIKYSDKYRFRLKILLNSTDSIPWRFNDDDGWKNLINKIDDYNK